ASRSEALATSRFRRTGRTPVGAGRAIPACTTRGIRGQERTRDAIRARSLTNSSGQSRRSLCGDREPDCDMRRGCCAATEPTSPRPNRIDSWLPPSVRERRPDDRRVPAVSSLSRAEPRLADSVSRVRAGAVSATNIRTMPVVLAHWNGKAYRLDLPDGTHYAETK